MNYYRVYLRDTGELIAEGDVHACAQQRGIAVESFRTMVQKNRNGTRYQRYKILVESRPNQKQPSRVRPDLSWEKKFIREWDAFYEPIRKKYGIAVKRDDG